MENKKLYFNLLKAFFLALLLYFVHKEVGDRIDFNHFISIFNDERTATRWLLPAFILHFFNIAVEAQKFRLVLKKRVGFMESVRAVYAGSATAFITPDRLGNFIGRLFKVKNIAKQDVVIGTLLGNFSQFLTTLFFAFLALVLYDEKAILLPFDFSYYLLLFAISTAFVLLFLLYINIEWLIERVSFIKRFKTGKYIVSLKRFFVHFTKKERFILWGYSVLRYVVFALQFLFLLKGYGVVLSFYTLIIFIGLLYLFSTLIPSPIWGNLGTREAVAVLLLQHIASPENVILASLSIWIINIVFPALIGGILLSSWKKSKINSV